MLDKNYTTDEVAEMLGVTAQTIRNWISNGTLLGIRIGGQWRVRHEALAAMLKAGESKDA